jgi:hypothetical protein
MTLTAAEIGYLQAQRIRRLATLQFDGSRTDDLRSKGG